MEPETSCQDAAKQVDKFPAEQAHADTTVAKAKKKKKRAQVGSDGAIADEPRADGERKKKKKGKKLRVADAAEPQAAPVLASEPAPAPLSPDVLATAESESVMAVCRQLRADLCSRDAPDGDSHADVSTSKPAKAKKDKKGTGKKRSREPEQAPLPLLSLPTPVAPVVPVADIDAAKSGKKTKKQQREQDGDEDVDGQAQAPTKKGSSKRQRKQAQQDEEDEDFEPKPRQKKAVGKGDGTVRVTLVPAGTPPPAADPAPSVTKPKKKKKGQQQQQADPRVVKVTLIQTPPAHVVTTPPEPTKQKTKKRVRIASPPRAPSPAAPASDTSSTVSTSSSDVSTSSSDDSGSDGSQADDDVAPRKGKPVVRAKPAAAKRARTSNAGAASRKKKPSNAAAAAAPDTSKQPKAQDFSGVSYAPYLPAFEDSHLAPKQRDMSMDAFTRWGALNAKRQTMGYKEWVAMYLAFADTYRVVPKAAAQLDDGATFQTHFERLLAMPPSTFAGLHGVWLSNYEVKVARTAAELDAEEAASHGGDLSPTFAVYLAARHHGVRPLGIISAKKSATKVALGQFKLGDAVVYVGSALKALHVAASPFCLTLDDRQFTDNARGGGGGERSSNAAAAATAPRKRRAAKPKAVPDGAAPLPPQATTPPVPAPAHAPAPARQTAPPQAQAQTHRGGTGISDAASDVSGAVSADDTTVTTTSGEDDDDDDDDSLSNGSE